VGAALFVDGRDERASELTQTFLFICAVRAQRGVGRRRISRQRADALSAVARWQGARPATHAEARARSSGIAGSCEHLLPSRESGNLCDNRGPSRASR